MRNIRIGNDIKIEWTIAATPHAITLEGKDLRFFLQNRYIRIPIKQYEVTESRVAFTFYGKDQKHTGPYTLVMDINAGKEDMGTVDVRDAFCLVDFSHLSGGNDLDCVRTESLQLYSEVTLMGGINIVIDEELKADSPNPISNAAVTVALSEKASELKELKDILIIAPTNDAPTLMEAFKKYDLSKKVGIPMPCLIKKERSDTDLILATLLIEDYLSAGAGWRLTFAINKNGALADPSSPDYQERIYSPDCLVETIVLSYLYNEFSGYVIPLGAGSVGRRKNSTLAVDIETLSTRVSFIEQALHIK